MLTIQVIFNLYRGQVPRIKELENFKCKDAIGFDVYQRVNELHLFIEPDNVSSKEFTVEGMKKKSKRPLNPTFSNSLIPR